MERINAVKPTWDLKGFIDNNVSIHGMMGGDYPVVGGCDCLEKLPGEVWAVCAVGSARTRKNIVEKLKAIPNVRFATLVDPSVICSPSVVGVIGKGSIICA